MHFTKCKIAYQQKGINKNHLPIVVCFQVIECFQGKIAASPLQLRQLIQLGNNADKEIYMSLSLTTLEKLYGISNAHQVLKIEPDEIIKKVQHVKDFKTKYIIFAIDRNLFVKDTIENCPEADVGCNKKNIVIEFSSPNIAKPFHVGHLRSTIIGNFIANLHSYFKNHVIRLNYLGDWGTQFGFIKVGIDKLKHTNEAIQKNPIKLLYESYVHANRLGENDTKVHERAKQEFSNLEKGLPEILNDWKRYVDYTKTELEAIYDRLGVKFDEYHRESMYNINDIEDIVNTLTNKSILQVQADGKKVAVINDRNVTIVKSDGSSLYLTRDIAAAVDRFKKYKFDQMYYVVENGQNDHFNALKAILYKMDLPWAQRLHHVKFGRIRGMSTRKGTAVFLRDILDECLELMVQKQLESPSTISFVLTIYVYCSNLYFSDTKVSITDSQVADILGVSCVIVNDLKQRRQKDYDFSWDRALQVIGSACQIYQGFTRFVSLIMRVVGY